jgi:DNA-binding IclR family transcriptional regulator
MTSGSISISKGDQEESTKVKTVIAGSQTVDRALSLLECFSAERPSLYLYDLSRQTGLTTPTTHRLLKALESREFVSFDPASKLYTLGASIVRLASIVIKNSDIQTVVFPWLERLRLLTGETAALHWLVEHHRVCVLEFESRHPMRMISGTGKRYSLLRGAAGKALLANLDPAGVHAAIEEAETLDSAILDKELLTIREQGYAMSFSEVVVGANAIAVPILNLLGQPIAAINITGPEYRLDAEAMKRYVDPLLEAVSDIQSRLGHS